MRQLSADKLLIKPILNHACSMYKKHFRLFLHISSYIVVLNMADSALNITQAYVPKGGLLIIHKLISVIFFFVYFYFLYKFTIAQYIIINESYMKRDITVKKALRTASGTFWGYFKTIVIINLISLLPAGIIAVGVRELDRQWALYITMLFLAVYVAYIMTIFSFTPLMSIVSNKKSSFFYLSRILVKGDFFKTFLLTVALPQAVLLPNLINRFFFSESLTPLLHQKLLNVLIYGCINLLLPSFFLSVQLLMYYKLSEIKVTKIKTLP